MMNLADAYLLKSCSRGDLRSAQLALDDGHANPNCSDSFGLTPLLLASSRGDHAMIDLLMKRGADPRCVCMDGMYPMAIAAAGGRTDVMQAIGAHCWDAESPSTLLSSALEIALFAQQHRSVEHLLLHGADTIAMDEDGQNMLARMIRCNQLNAVKALLDSGQTWASCLTEQACLLSLCSASSHLHIHEMLVQHTFEQPMLARLKVKALNPMRERGLFSPYGSCGSHGSPAALAQASSSTPGATSRLMALLTGRARIENGAAVGSDFNSNAADPVHAPPRDDSLGSRLKVGKVQTDLGAALKGFLQRHVFQLRWHAHWSRPHMRKRVRATHCLIEALHAGRLEKAWSLYQRHRALIITNAMDEQATPLLILVAQCLHRQGAHVQELPPSESPQRNCELALSLIADLCDNGANPLSRDPATGNTVVHIFAHGPFMHVLLRAMDAGPLMRCLNTSNRRLERPLHICARQRDTQGIKGLLARGADRNPVNNSGYTPLHLCALNLDVDTASLLIQSGANLQLRTRSGQTIDQIIATIGQHSKSFDALIQAKRGIARVMSIFTPGNPMASHVRHTSATLAGKKI